MTGLRERKKVETRQRISDAARRLLFERGYDAVTMTAVAEEAEVSPATVFNYFRTKEDLFFSGLETFETHLIAAVRDRPVGASVFGAFRDAVLASIDNLAAPRAVRGIARAAEVIASSRALQDHERVVRARHAEALAAVISRDVDPAGSDVEVAAIAAALMAVHGALVQHARLLASRHLSGKGLVRAVRRQATSAFDRLEEGLAGYGVR